MPRQPRLCLFMNRNFASELYSSTSATAGDAANGTTPGAKSDTDNDDDISLGSSDVEDPEITAYDTFFFHVHSCPYV